MAANIPLALIPRPEMRILVVDDEKEIRELVRDVLIDDGYEVDEAADGKAAIDKAGAQQFDLVFCDVKMDPIDGFAVLRAFREVQPQAEVILMTGHGSLEAALEAVREGAVDYICKPFEIDDVSAMARAAEERQRLKREPNEARAGAIQAGGEPEFSGLIGRSP